VEGRWNSSDFLKLVRDVERNCNTLVIPKRLSSLADTLFRFEELQGILVKFINAEIRIHSDIYDFNTELCQVSFFHELGHVISALSNDNLIGKPLKYTLYASTYAGGQSIAVTSIEDFFDSSVSAKSDELLGFMSYWDENLVEAGQRIGTKITHGFDHHLWLRDPSEQCACFFAYEVLYPKVVQKLLPLYHEFFIRKAKMGGYGKLVESLFC
jgi:hypothetical protein